MTERLEFPQVACDAILGLLANAIRTRHDACIQALCE